MPLVILALGQDGKPLLSDQSLRGQGSSRSPTSLGITRCREGREGFPDMSRFALLFTEQEASCHLPDKEFRSELLLATLWLRPAVTHRRVGHFCRPLHVAIQLGLYLPQARCLGPGV
jgi:hypothetical protein